jgi:hypothetical protein
MRWMRSQHARIAGGWLVIHLCLLASVPTALCSMGSSSAVAVKCTCDHADGGMCAMHHSRSVSALTTDHHSCACRSASDPAAAMAASLLGPVAVLAASASAILPTMAGTSLPAFNPAQLDSSSVPHSPPPRG